MPLQGAHKLGELGLGDLARAIGDLAEESVDVGGLLARRSPNGLTCLSRGGPHDLEVGGADALGRRAQLPLRGRGARGELGELDAGLQQQVPCSSLVCLVRLQRLGDDSLGLCEALNSIISRARDALQLHNGGIVSNLGTLHNLGGLRLSSFHGRGPLLHGLLSENLGLGFPYLLELILALLEDSRLSSGRPLLEGLNLGLLGGELRADLQELGLDLGQGALLDARDFDGLLVGRLGCLHTAGMHGADVGLNALQPTGEGRGRLEIHGALFVREGHPHVAAVPHEGAHCPLVTLLVILQLEHLDALTGLHHSDLLAAIQRVRCDHALLAHIPLTQQHLEVHDVELPALATNLREDCHLLFLREVSVIHASQLCELVQESTEFIELGVLVLGDCGPDSVRPEPRLLGMGLQRGHEGLRERGRRELRPVVGQQRCRHLGGALDIRLQLREAGRGVLDELLRDKPLLALRALLRELGELHLARCEPGLEL
mmetsp:Transcript_28490/g.81962  ORF Transcript_28490/g.81962 Transcript_28490/m.81962 type:complete len:487 (+) Transcript_28490:1596-3056(+)